MLLSYTSDDRDSKKVENNGATSVIDQERYYSGAGKTKNSLLYSTNNYHGSTGLSIMSCTSKILP